MRSTFAVPPHPARTPRSDCSSSPVCAYTTRDLSPKIVRTRSGGMHDSSYFANCNNNNIVFVHSYPFISSNVCIYTNLEVFQSRIVELIKSDTDAWIVNRIVFADAIISRSFILKLDVARLRRNNFVPTIRHWRTICRTLI